MSTSRLDELRMVDPVLTTIAQGYSNSAMVAEFLFPSVQVSKLKGKIPVFGREAFIVRETDRAIRAQSNRIPPHDIELVSFETKEQDIEVAIDYLEEEESPDFYKYEQHIAKELMDILLLGKEKEVADYVQNVNNFATGLKNVLDSNSAWDDSTLAGISPITDIWAAKTAIRQNIGRFPNTMVIGARAYKSLINHAALIEKVKYSGVTNISAKVIAELFDIPSVNVGMSVYSDDGVNFNDVWNDNVILAYVDKNEKANRTEFNPSYGYCFQREGKPEIDTYFENGGKIKVVRSTDNYCIKVTAADAAYLISHTNHNDA
ncbi:MAG: hypothetical protein HW421_3784 [Ignavibacteria bacterium]|nr:hypothetical protein [Ignavibacteria bacterium]